MRKYAALITFGLLASPFVGMLSGCAMDAAVDLNAQSLPVVPATRLEFTQRRVIPNTQTARLPSSFEHVAVAESDDSPTQIESLPIDTAQWTVTAKGRVKPTRTEAVAGENIHNGLLLNVFYGADKADTEINDAIKNLAAKLTSVSGAITIVGFTDRTIDEFHHTDLALSRAQGVADKLAKLGVKKDRITVSAGGVSKLYADDGRNRRSSVFLKME